MELNYGLTGDKRKELVKAVDINVNIKMHIFDHINMYNSLLICVNAIIEM